MSQSFSSPIPEIKSQNYHRNKVLTMVGSLLIQFSAGLIPVWGNANLYFLSYFKNNGQHVDKQTNSLILLATVIPMCCMIVFSTKFSNYLGQTKMIKICAIIYFFSYLVIYIKFNMAVCVVFLLIIPITVNSMSFVPMYNCLWSYYMEKKNMVTGYVLLSYGISGIMFNILFLYLVNPENLQAKLNDNGFVYFDKDVSNNLLSASKIIYLLCSVVFLAGAFMIRRQDQEIGQEKQDNSRDDADKRYELKEQPQENPQKSPSLQSQKAQNKDKQHSQLNEYASPKEYQLKQYKDDSPCSILPSQSKSSHYTNNQAKQQQFVLRKYLFGEKFILIFCVVLFIDFYATYVVSNFKIIYIEKINDDHFLGYCLVVNTVTALIGTFIWGFLGDMLGFAKTMLSIVITDLIFKLVGIVSDSKGTLVILMGLIGLTSRGMQTISGPGLVQVFGLRIATQLLPIKALAVIGPMICVPIIQLMLSRMLSPFELMNGLMLINLILIGISIYFKRNYQFPTRQMRQQSEEQEGKDDGKKDDGKQLR